MTRDISRMWLPSLAAMLAACSAQVDSDYQGEPMATLQGVVTSKAALDAPQGDIQAAIIWLGDGPHEYFSSLFVGSQVGVRGSFPVSFTLDIYSPPPPEVEAVGDVPRGRLGFWRGLVAAVGPDVSGEITVDDVLGIDNTHQVIYLDRDIETTDEILAELATAGETGTPMEVEELMAALTDGDYVRSLVDTLEIPGSAGFHLAKVNPANLEAYNDYQRCVSQHLCVHEVLAAEVVAAAQTPTEVELVQATQASYDHQFERCVEAFPDAPTCEKTRPHSGIIDLDGWQEPEQSVQCDMQQTAVSMENGCEALTQAFRSGEIFVENAADLADPITIELGTTIWDAQYGF